MKSDGRRNNGGARFAKDNTKRRARALANKGKGGRPKGRRNKMSMAMRLEAQKTGELPHEFMLRIMRMIPGDENARVGDHEIEWDDILWAAEKAAPFYAAKLAAVAIKGDRPAVVVQLDPTKLKGMQPEELQALLQALLGAVPTQPATNDMVRLPSPIVINGAPASAPPQDDVEDVDPALYESSLQ